MSIKQNVFFWLLLTFHYSTVASSSDYNFLTGYVSSYSSGPRHSGVVRSTCVDMCLQNQLTTFYFYAITHYLPSNDCWCNEDSTFTTMTLPSSWLSMIVWRPPINFDTTALEIGDTRKINVLYLHNIGPTIPDSIFRYYVADSLLNVTKKSGRLIIDYTTVTNEAGSSQNNDDFKARKFNIHEITKRNTSIEETFETITEHPQWLQGAYSFDSTLIDMDLIDDESLHFVSILENDFIAVIDIKALEVKRKTVQNCDALLKTSQRLMIDEEFLINVFMSTETDCVIDLKNISMEFYFEDIIQPQVKQNESCIDPTTIQVNKNKITIKFDVLYIHSEICFDLSFTTNTTLKGIGSRKTTIFNEIKYQKYVDNVPTTVQLNNSFTTYISKGEKAFYLRDETSSEVLEINKEDELLSFPPVKTRSQYVYFKMHPHNLKSVDGRCLSYDSLSNVVLEECEKKRRLKNFVSAPQFIDSEQYIAPPKLAAGRPSDLKRKYIGAYGLNSDKSADVDKKTVYVTRLQLDDSSIICATANRRGERCARIYLDHKVTVYPAFMYEILAIHSEKNETYASDGNGRIFMFKTDDIKSKSFISNELYEKLLTDNKLVIANKSDPDHLENGKEITFGDGSQITPLGFKIEVAGKHQFIWPSSYQICEGITNLKIVHLESCKHIKQYCKNAKSGVYGVSGITGDITNWKKVYCDMETDEGGWLMVANIAVRNGNFTPNSLTMGELEDVVSSNYQTVIESSALATLLSSFIKFNEIRFYCYGDNVKRKMHMKTTASSDGINTKDYFTMLITPSSRSADSCSALDILYDDTSIIGSSCDRIVATPYYPTPLYHTAFGIPSDHAFAYDHNGLMACDDPLNGDIENGDWKIYVR